MISGKTEQTVFFGSGPVAAAALERLIEHTSIEVVITKPRPEHHKGSTPVLEIAEKYNLPIVTVSNKSDVDTALAQHTFASRYGILIDFGIIISQKAIDKFSLGIINSHFSLLPHLRGADPITWSIINGDKKTGVSLMLVDEGMDTGQLLAQESLTLNQTENTPLLTDKLIELSDEMLRKFVPQYLNGMITASDQPSIESATYSRKIDKSDGTIDWNEPAIDIERKIRAYIDWPQSRTKLGPLDVIITQAHVANYSGVPGDYLIDGKQLIVYSQKQALAIDALKPAGKKEMPVAAFLSGYKQNL